ncbi:hypothetical protein BJY16_007709 [Actinoplanes octamycinicus]|uniref:Uncharacterized protein n=1 Tax=Actinoplanes octamycinicus TaxID=135948 RepID=A0A7W7H590_9ACTN|nr:hypothetical protein [Actinoplanes octamycinicus]MBB4744250.1 hypothetical protein [Actinoplanes octamycinicus]
MTADLPFERRTAMIRAGDVESIAAAPPAVDEPVHRAREMSEGPVRLPA